MNTNIFDYPLWQRLVRTAFLIFGLALSVFMLVSILISLILSVLDPARQLGAEVLSTLIPLGVTFLFALGFLVVYLMFPSIHIRESGLQIRTPIYRSGWLSWDQLDVKELWLPSRKQGILGVIAEDISPLYAIIGLTQFLGAGKRAFLIHHTLDGYQHLLTILREKRPDLFEESDKLPNKEKLNNK